MLDDAIVVESSPTLPLEPASPNKRKIIGIGTLIGLVCAIGLALFLGQLDKTVKTVDEVKSGLGISALGVVPLVSSVTRSAEPRNETEMRAPELSPYQWPTSPLADSLRIVLNAVATQIDLNSKVVLAVSSALPAEGKTFISMSLAAALASDAKAVLVMDCDLRNPGIHRIFGAGRGAEGLAGYLDGKFANALETIQETPIPGLYYLPSGPMPNNPVAALKSPSMQELIQTCKKTFDMVLIDTPPILGLADATVLAGYSDGLILVARQGHTSLDAIRAAKEQIIRGKGRLLGIVLNKVERRLGHYDYYHAQPYARYHAKRS